MKGTQSYNMKWVTSADIQSSAKNVAGPVTMPGLFCTPTDNALTLGRGYDFASFDSESHLAHTQSPETHVVVGVSFNWGFKTSINLEKKTDKRQERTFAVREGGFVPWAKVGVGRVVRRAKRH
jgi:hypothetical protein